MIPTFIAGSFPKIVTTGKTRRKNEEGMNDEFIRNYIKLLGELLLVKKDLKDIRFTYIGGYEGIENLNTGKLYFSALDYFFKELGYGSLDKTNFKIVDEESYKNNKSESLNILENTDFLFLGLGDDSIFGSFLDTLNRDGIDLKKIINRNNTLVCSTCAGSVVTSFNIYGGKYDNFYHNREPFSYPKNYPSLMINPVTMETNLYKEGVDKEKNDEFRDTCLLPDSYEKAFFGCRPNSYIAINNDIITAVGEIYLFIDGEILSITDNNEVKDITKLNELVNKYNENKSIELKEQIKNEMGSLIDLNNYVDTFKKEETKVKEIKDERKKYLKVMFLSELETILNNINLINKDNLNKEFKDALNLETDNNRELYLKYYLVGLVKKYSNLYGNNYSEYFKDLYELFSNLENPEIILYFVECFSSCYQNKEMKDLLLKIKLEPQKRVNKLNKTNTYFKRFWRIYA